MLLSEGRLALDIALITSSHAVLRRSSDDTELLRFDGESTHFEINFRYGLTEGWEIGADLPYIWHESGGLDSLIEGWHDLLGLPNGARDVLPKNELAFTYQDGTGTRIGIDSNSNGPGDLRVFLGTRLSSNERRSTALRFSVKFPTGDSANLHGSGSTDVSAGIASDYRQLWGQDRLNGFYRVHMAYLGTPDRLADRSKRFVGQVSAGLGYFATDKIELRIQSAVRSAVYDSDISSLGEPAVSLTFGANFALSEQTTLSLGVAEDIRVYSTPDVSFQLALQYRPR